MQSFLNSVLLMLIPDKHVLDIVRGILYFSVFSIFFGFFGALV